MALSLDHTIVPAKDKEESVRFIAKLLGLEYKGPWGHFAPLKINDALTLDFDNHEKFEGHHYALLASDEEFDAILKRVREEGVSYGSGPGSQDDGKINHLGQKRITLSLCFKLIISIYFQLFSSCIKLIAR